MRVYDRGALPGLLEPWDAAPFGAVLGCGIGSAGISGPIFKFAPQHGDTTGVKDLVDGVPLQALIADKAYDADGSRFLAQRKAYEAVIPARVGRSAPAEHDAEKYKWRHPIENFFQKIKEFKRIAMRSCKTDTRFAAMIKIAATVIRLR